MYPFPLDLPVVAGSDGAGEVLEVGPKVTKFKRGDKVVTLFNQHHQAGPIDNRGATSGLGGVFDGTLRQYGVFNEDGVVRAPANLSHVEAATLTCAALTSWNALYGLKPLKPGETVLVQGTGGVSLFALQFAKAAGARVIATTSSKEKMETLKKLGADHVINYREDKNWGETARKLTVNEQGVDHVIEVGGEDTMGQSLKAVKYEGIISLIGFLGGAQPKDSILEPLSKICTIRGIYVGSRQQLEEMCAAIEANDIHPVVDEKIFTLDQVKEAYEYMVSCFWSYEPRMTQIWMLTTENSGPRSTLARSVSRSSKFLDNDLMKYNNDTSFDDTMLVRTLSASRDADNLTLDPGVS